MLNLKADPTEAAPITLDTTQLLRARFNHCYSLLTAYSKYLKVSRNANKLTNVSAVLKIADSMVEQFDLGAKLIDDIRFFINDSYQVKDNDIRTSLEAGEEIKGSLDTILLELDNAGIMAKFDVRFQSAVQ